MKKKKNIFKINKLPLIKEYINIFVMDKKIITTLFISTFISGFIAHGVGLINKYCFHDDIVCLNLLGATFRLGRFTVAIANKIGKTFLGTQNFSLQLINGLLAFIFIFATSYLIVKLLSIKNKYFIILIPCLIVSSPPLITTLSYRFLTHVFELVVFLGTLYIYILTRTKSKVLLVFLAFLQAFNIGMYQGFISFWLTVSCIYIIKESYDNKYSLKKTFKIGMKHVIFHFLSFVFYLILMKISLFLTNESLSTYRNISNLGVTSLSGYIIRIINTYKYYFILPIGKRFNIFLLNTHILYYIVFVIVLVLVIKNKIYKKVSSGTYLALALFPLCVHFNIVMAGNDYDLIQAHSVVFQYLILMFILDRVSSIKDLKYLFISIFILFIVVYQYIYLSNICYLKAEFLQSKAITYNQTLITRIQSTPNYKINMPVCYINEFNKNIDDVYIKPSFKNIRIYMYYDEDLRNNYAWREFMANWNGFNPVTIDQTKFENSPIVKNMPCYPDDGSIKVINNVVVVKFSD